MNTSLSALADILLVEDDGLISLDTEDMLLSLGVGRVHVAHNLAAAESIIASQKLDAAVLDLIIGAQRSEGVARYLIGQSVPVIFASGYDDIGAIAEGLEDVPTVRKPYSAEALETALAAAINGLKPD